MIEKAASRGADVVILDLEDGVHPDLKGEARLIVAGSVASLDWGSCELLVRINGPDTEWAEEDITTFRQVGMDGLILPKVAQPAVVERLASSLGDLPLFLMIENAEGVLAAPSLAKCTSVAGLIFGAADYRESLRASRLLDEVELGFGRASVLHAARAAGVEAFDTPWFAFKDLDGLNKSAELARGLGFDGKTVIHPSQIPVINRVFSPTTDEIVRAREIVAVMERVLAEGRNVATLGNEMVEALHLKEARRILSLVETNSELSDT